jgi:inosine-uridine nucleoside N-ribohydrolase
MKNLMANLQRPTKPVSAVLDTDTYNEIDDQFALAYFMLSTEAIRPQAVYAAPFANTRAATPAEGMEKSYGEILRVLELCGFKDFPAYRGSAAYLPDEKTSVASPAAQDLVARALAHSPENPLYVLTIGCITNIASAILMEPAICDRIVIVWLGGHAHHWPVLWGEFNMSQDIAAARVVFNSGAALVQLPCMGVVSHLSTTEPELRAHCKGKSPLGDYLYGITCHTAVEDGGNAAWSRVIWDISVVAWLLGKDYVRDMTVTAPLPSYDNGYVNHSDRHPMKVAYHVNRDAIFLDLFKKIGFTKSN